MGAAFASAVAHGRRKRGVLQAAARPGGGTRTPEVSKQRAPEPGQAEGSLEQEAAKELRAESAGEVRTDPRPAWTPVLRLVCAPAGVPTGRLGPGGCAWGSRSPYSTGARASAGSHPLAPVYEAKGKCLISRLIAWVIGRRTQLSK